MRDTEMESMEDMWKKFSLSDKECLNVDLADTSQQPEHILAAKFLTSRVLNMDAVARTFKPLWKTKQSFMVQDLGGNKVAFVFKDAMDLERVLVNEHWTYDKFLVVFQRVRRTEEAAVSIGRTIGVVEKVAACDDERGGENCMRVRIRMEVNNPLCRGRLVKFEVDKDCDVGLQQRQSNDQKDYQFGAWLRASSDRPPHKTVVVVPGNQPKRREKPTSDEPPNHQLATELEELTSDRSENSKNPENTEKNPENEMEIEHNSGLPNPNQVQKSNAELFSDQLKEIDQAIHYMPYGENIPEENSGHFCNENFLIDHGPKSVGPQAQSVSPFASPTHRPLKDISNGLCNNQKQKSSTTKWKKLARAHKPTSSPPTTAQPLKRDLMLIDEGPTQGKRLRATLNQCNFDNTNIIDNTLAGTLMKISAEAGPQPYRKP
uniref:DUF4283 domain-containing protein n=1 Tax=Fagus sylvatica TaxID=28930 RepID=A0A2N9FNY2_FAGSY